MKKSVNLKVAEALQDDINKGIARIDGKSMEELGVKEGGVIMIKGKKTAAATVGGPYLGDMGLDMIRMDGVTRRNAEAGIGDFVSISKADAKEAKKIVITPAREGIIVSAPGHFLKRWLMGKATMKGSIITFTDNGPKYDINNLPFFKDIGLMIDSAFDGSLCNLKFMVLGTEPKGIVKIACNTEIIIKESKFRKKSKPLVYSKSKKTLFIKKKMVAKAIGIKPAEIKKVVLK